jgi:hypothetical protein
MNDHNDPVEKFVPRDGTIKFNVENALDDLVYINPLIIWKARAGFVVVLYAVLLSLAMFIKDRITLPNLLYMAASLLFIGLVCIWLFDEDSSFNSAEDKQ